MASILLADDHAIVRQGLRMIIEKEFPSAVIGEAKNADGVAQLMRVREWELLLLDLSMPGKSGLEVLRDIKATRPRQKVLVLSMHAESQFAARVLKAGAVGYVTKDSGREELIRAIRMALEGRRYISAEFAETLADGLISPTGALPHTSLSNREYEILRGLAGGRGITELAQSLALSPKTVSTYRKRILDKMRLHSNADLVRYTVENQLF